MFDLTFTRDFTLTETYSTVHVPIYVPVCALPISQSTRVREEIPRLSSEGGNSNACICLSRYTYIYTDSAGFISWGGMYILQGGASQFSGGGGGGGEGGEINP